MMTLDIDTMYIDFDWLTVNFEIKKTVNFMHIKIIVNDTRQTLTYIIKIVFRVVRIHQF
jgi:hypothetical protein